MRARWLGLVVVLAGCGYRFAVGPGALPEGLTEVRAPIFVNRTAEPGLEVAFTQALRQHLTRAGVATTGSAEAEIVGEVLSLGGGPTIVTARGSLASYRLHGAALVKLLKGGRVIAEAHVTGAEDFLPGHELLRPEGSRQADVLQTEANRQAAIERLAEAMMQDAYERLAAAK
jgi:hypothetical protein